MGEGELGYLLLRSFFAESLSVGSGILIIIKLYFGSDNPILQQKLLGGLVVTLDLGLDLPVPGSFSPILPTPFQMAAS